MPSTLSSLRYHVIFSTKERRNLIASPWKQRLFEYMAGCLKKLEAFPLAIGGTENHAHVLMGLKPTHTLSQVVRELKQTSSKWVHQEIGCGGFSWQEGYGAFTVSPPAVEDVRRYITDQEEHHRVKTFQEEYLAMLKKCGVEYDERYVL